MNESTKNAVIALMRMFARERNCNSAEKGAISMLGAAQRLQMDEADLRAAARGGAGERGTVKPVVSNSVVFAVEN